MSKIKIKKVTFHNRPDFILTIEQWHSIGGYQGFLKHNEISIMEIKQVITTEMSEKKFFQLDAWEG